MHTICYISKAASKFSSDDLDHIFQTTMKNNANNEISGILLFKFNHFMQVLEGEKQTLETLFEKIKLDTRHHEIFVILNGKSRTNIFKNYATGFSIAKSTEEFKRITAYLKTFRNEIPNVKYVNGLMEPFLI